MLRPLAHLDWQALDRRPPDPSAASMPVRVSRRALALLEALCALRASPRRRRWTGAVAVLCQQAMLTPQELDEAAYELALRGLLYSHVHDPRGVQRYFAWRPLKVGATVLADPGHECAWVLERDLAPTLRWDVRSRGVWYSGPPIRDDSGQGYWLTLRLGAPLPRRVLTVAGGPTGVVRVRLEVTLPPGFDSEADAVRLGRLWSCELSALGRLVSMPRCV